MSIMIHRYIVSNEGGKEFEQLPGHYKRAIQTQANIEVLGYQLSKSHGKLYEKEQSANDLFIKICNEYAKDEEKYKKFACEESRALYLYPLKKDREVYYYNKAKEFAENLDFRANYKKKTSDLEVLKKLSGREY